MIEPKPIVVHIQEPNEEGIRVGIVLFEDNLATIDLRLLAPLRISSDNSECLSVHDVLTLRSDGDSVHLFHNDQLLLSTHGVLRFVPLEETFPAPSMEVFPVIAGRSFHWKKQIRAAFPGEFSIRAKGGVLQIVNSLPFEQYLACVVVSEMSSGTPPEFVKAQTVCARSWARCFLREKHPGEDYDLCNDDDCQRYHGVTFAAPESLRTSLQTAGENIVTGDGYIVPAYYSKCCGGITEGTLESFGFEAPGLRSVIDGRQSFVIRDLERWISGEEVDSGCLYCGGDKQILMKNLGGVDDVGEYFRWTHRETKDGLGGYLRAKMGMEEVQRVVALKPLRRGPSGRIHELSLECELFDGTSVERYIGSQYDIRRALHESFLFSSAITIQDEGDTFLFRGAGWGHGVGLCQIGGMFQAIEGRSYLEILKLYFPDCEIRKR